MNNEEFVSALENIEAISKDVRHLIEKGNPNDEYLKHVKPFTLAIFGEMENIVTVVSRSLDHFIPDRDPAHSVYPPSLLDGFNFCSEQYEKSIAENAPVKMQSVLRCCKQIFSNALDFMEMETSQIAKDLMERQEKWIKENGKTS